MSDRNSRFTMQQMELLRSLLHFLRGSAEYLRAFLEQVESPALRDQLRSLAHQIDAQVRRLEADQS